MSAVLPAEPTPRNAFTDLSLSAAAVRLFAVLCSFDRGRGCWASRETLARLTGLSLSTINHSIPVLAERGYLTVTRRKDLPAVLRIYPEARHLSGLIAAKSNLQPVAKTHELHEKHEENQDSTTGIEVVPTLYPPVLSPVVVSGGEPFDQVEPPVIPNPRFSEESEEMPTLALELTAAGVVRPVALALARKSPPTQIRAALRYVNSYRGEVLNPPGLLRHLLETASRLPKWAFEGIERKDEPPETPIEPRSQDTAPSGPGGTLERERRRAASPWRELWERVSGRLEARLPRQSYQTWIVPAFIDRIEAGTVALNAPTEFFAGWIETHYLDVIEEELRAEGMDVEQVEVEGWR